MSDYSDYTEFYKKAWEKALGERHSELQDEVKLLRQQNARYREALEYIAHHEALPAGQREYVNKVATDALNGVE